MNNKIAVSFLIFSTLFSSLVFALPCAFFGTVTIDGNPVNGTLVAAYVNGTYVKNAKEFPSFGNYSIVVDAADNNVTFKIGGMNANEPEQICTSGGYTYLNLTASKLADGQECVSNSDCTSDNCAADYDGSGKWCAPSGNCAHDNITNYTTGATVCYDSTKETCGNGLWIAEVCSYGCSDGNCNSPPSGGGGGFTGGGGGYVCTENWTCTAWLDCVAGTQIRTCTDANKCGTTKNKPTETQTCTVQQVPPTTCTEDWSCGDWSMCIDNRQTRTCTDANNCGTTIDKPIESQDCVSETTQPPSTITGQFLGLTTTDWVTAVVAGIIIALIIILLAKRKELKKK
jgi:hypothetical protein